MKTFFLILFFFLSAINFISSQEIDNIYIIKANNIVPSESIQEALGLSNIPIDELRIISEDLKLYRLKTNIPLSKDLIRTIELNQNVSKICNDVSVESRANPNDPLFDDQWAITLAKIDEVWDYTTGGETENGEQIVVAVLDDGYSINHIDMQGVFLENQGEIPNNNIDDDNNGYVDDFIGLNIINDGDQHPEKTHGTAVTGIIGANGDNGIGMSGVNWNIKILPISNVTTVGRIIESYQYILNMRRRYNNTDGAEGAMIAFTSFSGGVPNVFGSSGIYIDWCNMYDLLGLEGVLNFGATTNRFVNVDEVGDMPTTCTSEYFIAVTGLNRSGQVNESTGYGPISIDLAAPSNGIVAPSPNDGFSDFNGTSAATPMVAGVAALLYSLPCANLGALIKDNRIESIKLIRDVILDGVTESQAMNDLYVTGGYLNASKAMLKLINICEDSSLLIPSVPGALQILSIKRIADKLQVFYASPNNETHFIRWVDPIGRILYYNEFIPQAFGEKFSVIEIPIEGTGNAYLSIGNKRNTVSKGYKIIE